MVNIKERDFILGWVVSTSQLFCEMRYKKGHYFFHKLTVGRIDVCVYSKSCQPNELDRVNIHTVYYFIDNMEG